MTSCEYDRPGDFTLRGPAARVSLTATAKADGTPTVTLEVVPAAGKPRKKSFIDLEKALLAALADGTVATCGDAMFVRTAVGPPMGHAFAVDEARGVAWLGDWGALRRVDLADGRVESIALGRFPAVREVVGDGAGGALILADEDTAAPVGGFRAPAPGVVRHGVFHCDGAAVRPVHLVDVRRGEHGRVGLSLARAADGSMIVPHEAGVARLDPSGRVAQTCPVGPMKHWSARAAVSPNGRFVARSARSGQVAVWDGERGVEVVHNLDMDDVTSLVVYDDGVVDVGVATPDWDFQRLGPPGARARASHRAAKYMSSPDREWVYSVGDRWRATHLASGRERDGAVVAPTRGAALQVTDRHLYVRTGLGVFQRLPLG